MIVTHVLSIFGAWALAALIAFGIHLAVSMDKIKHLLFASIRASAPAMWIGPATLLVSEPHLVSKTSGLLI
ncbi:MAG TPA: hypothetical protein VEX68_13250, partial [Bryobacteraceae bacterium]|nr:hypothetical protein [Bryobacteraceae bacterium]